MSGTPERLFVRTETESLLRPFPDPSVSTFGEAVPSPRLREHVVRFHFGHERLPHDAPVDERVIPDGGVNLIFNLGDPPGRPDGAPTGISEAIGATLEPAVIRMQGNVEQVGVRLRAGGIAQVLGVPAGEVAGKLVPLDALWGARAGEALERLAESPPGPARAAAVEAVLLEILGRGNPKPSEVAAEAVRRISASGGRVRVRELAAALGVGERRLEQLFHRDVGLSPKAACRLARFRACVSLLRRGPGQSWSRLALRCGFYDQSHMVNEFRALSGLSPGDFAARSGFGFFQDGATARR
ncbi:MAG TPA: helix-turn-helix domain-containing protein [Longimicrobiaceae bacterium]